MVEGGSEKSPWVPQPQGGERGRGPPGPLVCSSKVPGNPELLGISLVANRDLSRTLGPQGRVPACTPRIQNHVPPQPRTE